jgi:hypothetical protein
MFGRWLFVRIRAAERALHEGRIDAAYATAAQPDVREQERGQKLLDGLARPLTARVRLHLQAGRCREALDDLDKLRAVGRLGPEAEDLQRRALAELQERQQRDAERRAALAQAAASLDEGRLESGRLAIERVDDTRQRAELREQLDVRAERSSQLLAQAGEALQRGDVMAALRFWQESCERHGRSRASDEFAGRLVPGIRQNLDEWFAQGRLERLLAARPGLAGLREYDPTLAEYEHIAALSTRATTQLGRRDFAGLRESLLRLRAARGGASWIDEALAALAQIAAAQDALLASPLGLFASAGGGEAGVSAGETPAATSRADVGGAPAIAGNRVNPVAVAAGRLPTDLADPNAAPLGPQPLLVLVDGAGSSLLISQDSVRIGRAGGSRPIDIPVPADILSHHADLVRAGEDCFLNAFGPVRINQREAQRGWLRDGDRVVLGAAARFVFRRPCARSESAVLTFSHRCRLPQDVGDVVLFRETCLIGPQPGCHIRTPEGAAQIVLFERGGRLYGRQATAGGGKLGDAKPIRLGETMDFGDVRITVRPYGITNQAGCA